MNSSLNKKINVRQIFSQSHQSFSYSIKSHPPCHRHPASWHVSHSRVVIYKFAFASQLAGVTCREEEIHRVALPSLCHHFAVASPLSMNSPLQAVSLAQSAQKRTYIVSPCRRIAITLLLHCRCSQVCHWKLTRRLDLPTFRSCAIVTSPSFTSLLLETDSLA